MVLDGHTSAALQVTSGVPQWSILGPLLFIIFMNSIFDVILSSSSKIILYADNMILYKPINNSQDLLDLQIDINKICSYGPIHLNAKKAKSILITRKKHRPILNFFVGRCPIPSVTSLKFLGVVITDNLFWSSHIVLKQRSSSGLSTDTFIKPPGLPVRDYTSSRFSRILTTVHVFGIPTKQSTKKLNSVQAFASKVVLQNWTAP